MKDSDGQYSLEVQNKYCSGLTTTSQILVHPSLKIIPQTNTSYEEHSTGTQSAQSIPENSPRKQFRKSINKISWERKRFGDHCQRTNKLNLRASRHKTNIFQRHCAVCQKNSNRKHQQNNKYDFKDARILDKLLCT